MKAKELLFGVLFFGLVNNIYGQGPVWEWARGAGTISNDYSNATCTDANGNVYITGTFQGSTITFGSYTLHNTATGDLDIFIVKYDASGNVLWAKSGGGTSYDYAYGICADVRYNVYITGYFRSPSITFGTITLSNADSMGQSTDIFISKYDSAGNVLWAKRAGSKAAWELSYAVCTDADSNVYITGRFEHSNVIFGNDTLINRGNYDIFITKYDADGNILWAKGAGGTQTEGGWGVCTDANTNVYVTGYFQNSATFGSNSIIGNGNVNIFVAKYDTYGNNLWAKSAIGTPPGSTGIGFGITADADGNAYVTGYFQYSLSLGNDTLGNNGTYSVFTAKYDSAGNALWGRSPGGTGYDYGNGICTNASGNIFVTGYFESSFLNFGGIPVINANVGYDDIFVAGYDANGNALWAKSIGGQDYDYGMGICSGGGNVYVTGYFGSYSLNFGNTTITNTGSYDVFLAKLSSTVGINEPFVNNNSFIIYPNPSHGKITAICNSTLTHLTLTDLTGRLILEKSFHSIAGENKLEIDVSGVARGVYVLSVGDGVGEMRGKVVVE